MAAGSRVKTDPPSTSARVSPGAHLRAELRRLGLDQIAVSKATGVSRQSVNNIINGRQAISRAMAGKLGRLTGHGSDYWLSEWFGEAGAPLRAAVSGVLVNHQIARAVHDGIIAIRPFISGHLQAASIDLTLGDEVAVGGRTIKLSADRRFALRPGQGVTATTAEWVELPLDYLGRLGGLAATRLGVLSPLHIPPGHRGTLSFGLFNAGPGPVTLRAGEPVAALEIVRLAAAADLR